MKQSLILTSVMSRMSFPKTKLENDINKHKRLSRGKIGRSNSILPGFENIAWQFANVPVSGCLEIVFADHRNNKSICLEVPAKTAFLAGCTRTSKGSYHLTFGVSLS